MKRLVPAIALILGIGLSAAPAEKKHTAIFEATVVRVDSWGPITYTCGIMLNYRLAEYKVDVDHIGHLVTGQHLVAKHLACNWNELDDLKPGDKVIVVAEMLKHPEKRSWQPTVYQDLINRMNNAKPNETIQVPMNSEPILVQCNVKKVSKLIYPSHP